MCRYSVVMKNGDEYQCDECSIRKFKFWFGLVKREIRNCVVWLDNGECWIYYYGRYRWRWEKVISSRGQLTLF